MTKRKKYYYALIGTNCVAVFDSWVKTEKAQKYAQKPRYKKFETFYEAEAYALELFLVHYPRGYPSISALKINEMLFTQHLRPQNLMEALRNTNNIPDTEPAITNDSVSDKYIITINLGEE